MESTKANMEKITWTERMNDNVDTSSINKEKLMVIEEFETTLNYLKGVEIKNEADLVSIKKPLIDLRSYLKYIPNGPFFNDVIPTEIKDYILSYLCDSKAFLVTSVCQEWKKILEKRFKDKEMLIGNNCSKCEDEDNECVKVVDMFKAAAAAQKLDVRLVVCKPVTEVDSKFITDGLTSVSKFTITEHLDYDNGNVPMSDEQLEHLFASMENGDEVMEEVNLVHLNLTSLNQERLANCLVNKAKRVTLDQLNSTVLDVKTFLSKIQQASVNSNLTHLTLHNFHLNDIDEFSHSNVADALSNVENVKLTSWSGFMTDNQIMERLVENILQRHVRIKTLILDTKDLGFLDSDFYKYKFESLFSPQDLTVFFNKMTALQLEGVFTLEQQEAIRALPDVEISRLQFRNSEEYFHLVKKGSSEMF